MLIFPDSLDSLLIFFIPLREKRLSPFYKLNLEHKNGGAKQDFWKNPWQTHLDMLSLCFSPDA